MFDYGTKPTYNYLVDLTFCAGRNEQQVVNNKLVIVSSKKQITADEMREKFNETNKLLDPFNEDDNFPFTYDDGLNIDMLLKGFEQHTRLKVTCLEQASIDITLHGFILNKINKKVIVKQWQHYQRIVVP